LGAQNEELEGVLLRIETSTTNADSNYFAGLLFSREGDSRNSYRGRKFNPREIQSDYSRWEDSHLAGPLAPVHEHKKSIVPVNINRIKKIAKFNQSQMK
jgi:hypothetical protein